MTLAPAAAGQLLPELHEPVEALEAAGIGALSARGSNLPLRRVAIRSRVHGVRCETTIAQVFANPHGEFVEATYIFPLPGRFAVTDCTMHVGGRVIKAELQERSQARATYNQAIAAGHRASIAEEERSETFTIRVGNIPPLEEVAVELTLVGEISVSDGEGTLRIPLVVAPRYVPGQPLDGPGVGLGTAQDTDEAPDASRVTPPTLLPGFPNPVNLSLEVELHPSPSLEHLKWRDSVRASLHSVLMSDSLPLRISLLPGERLNRDFILRFPVLPPETDAVAEYAPGIGAAPGTFSVTLFPPAKASGKQAPRDVVFVLDKSGSMAGWKIVAARRALARMIDTLRDTDRFRVLSFSTNIDSPQKKGTDWQVATDRERWQAAEWTAKIEAEGGTELAGALRAALQPFATFGMPADRDAVVILITDGQVAGEDSVLRTIESLRLPRMPRILTLGIDKSVNAGLLTRLAELGGGAFELVETEQRLDTVLERFHQKLAAPLLIDVNVDAIDGEVLHNTYTPAKHRQVCADRPLTIYGRCTGDPAKLRLRVIARDSAGGTWQQDVTASRTDSAALLSLWGRGRVRELEDQYARGTGDTSKLQQQIVATSLESHILSRFTAYVAVDKAEVVNKGGEQQQIVQPVETPEGWAADAVPIQQKLSRVRASRGLACALPPESISLDDVIRATKPRSDQSAGVANRLMELMSGMLSASSPPAAKPAEPTAAKGHQQPPQDLEELPKGFGAHGPFSLAAGCDVQSVQFFKESNSLSENSPSIVRLVELMLSEAVQSQISHIVLQPELRDVRLQFVWKNSIIDRDRLRFNFYSAVVGRLCILGKLAIRSAKLERGEFKFTVGNVDVDVIAYVIPTAGSPLVLLRLKCATCETMQEATPHLLAPVLAAAEAACAGQSGADAILAQLRADCGQ